MRAQPRPDTTVTAKTEQNDLVQTVIPKSLNARPCGTHFRVPDGDKPFLKQATKIETTTRRFQRQGTNNGNITHCLDAGTS
ncbi:hypothetical protein ABIC75_000603 [Dyella japonica]|uniref:Uncharacterized protein n=1 Tax=Dyella japonica TaxID=231455 RepID=A0ABV2JPZ2_9GAMM